MAGTCLWLSAGIELEVSNWLQMGDGRKLALDEHGHLENGEDWSEAVADRFAGQDGISLGDVHWLVLEILRSYYQDYGIEPPMRALVNEMKARGAEDCATSLELYRLFPDSPVRQGSRYAGLPIPVSCI